MSKMRWIRLSVVLLLTVLLPVAILLAQSDPGTRRFSLAIIPDTQYLFDQDRGDASVLTADFQWIIDNAESRNIVFTAQLGDIVENALPEEFEQADAVFDLLDENDMPYSVLAGNHDVSSSRQYDTERADEPYLNYFSPERTSDHPTFGGATENGFNTYYIFEGGGQEWLLFALDWQASIATLNWAQAVIDQHPTLPVIVTTHHLVNDDGSGQGDAVLNEYGQYLWDNLIANNDQIFLTINGHDWPAAQLVKSNAAGHDVNLHVTDYQADFYGGAGMMRLYEFDLDRNIITVNTFSPWVMAKPESARTQFDVPEMFDPTNHFVVELDFAQRFADFQGTVADEATASVAADEVLDGTVAYWRFDGDQTPAGEPLSSDGAAVADLSGNGNDLYRVDLLNSQPDDLIWTDDYAPGQPSRGSLYINGSKQNPSFGGAYLHTGDDAMLNSLTFEDGYTIEAFVRLPADCCDSHAWMGVLSRLGTGSDVGQTEGDLDEPVVQLALSGGRQFQWAIRTLNQQDILTNWSDEMVVDTWWHVALVNDGQRAVMYLNGAPILRNPRAQSIGLATNGDYWLIGAGHYANEVEQAFYGWLGDVRIVDHALTPDEFMLSQ